MNEIVYELDQFGVKRESARQFPLEPAAIERLLLRYAITPQRVAAAPSGSENQTLMVAAAEGSFVLRVYRQHKKTTPEIELELEFMEFLAQHGLAVPPVMKNKRKGCVTEVQIGRRTWQCILMNNMPGHHPRIVTQGLIRQLAAVQARIHQLGADYVVMRNKSIWARRTQNLVHLGLPCGYSHFDLTPMNVLWLNGHISAILDFDDMRLAPLVACLANSLILLMELSGDDELTTLYLREYRSRRRLSWREQAYLVLRLLGKRRRSAWQSAAWLMKVYRG